MVKCFAFSYVFEEKNCNYLYIFQARSVHKTQTQNRTIDSVK